MRAPTGEQFVLNRSTPFGPAEAIITEVGASIRTVRFGGIDITQPYAEFSLPPSSCGYVLVPWPNRVPDGVWELDGKKLQLDINEPDKHNAIHGFLRYTAYHVLARTDDSITLGATVYPQHGYPFLLETQVEYQLTDTGLTVTHRITNESDSPAPAAVGTHPFFQIGDVATDDLTLTLHANTRFPVDERLNVSAEVPVDGRYDLRGGVRVADLELDDAYGDVTPVDRVTATLTAPDGRTVSLWQDESFPYVQVYTTRIFPRGTEKVTAIAIEPMTAPANAFNTGQSLKWVQPGEEWQVSWGVTYSGPA